MRVVEIHTNSAFKQGFKQFLEKQGSVFFLENYTGLYEQNKLTQCAVLNKNNEVIGAFQYLRFKKLFFDCAITPPFMPSIGLQYVNPAESIVGKHSFDKDILELVAVYFKNLKVDLLDIALPTGITDTQPFTWLGFKSQFRYTYQLPLNLTEEELWTRLSSEKRKSISKAEKDGLDIKLCTDFKAALTMVLDGLKRNNALANQTLIEAIINTNNAEHLVMFGAYENGNLLAVTVCINDCSSLIYLFGGTANTGRHHGAGVSCMYKSILHAKQLGKSIFDFEGSMQPGIERYFREFGGDLVNFASISKHGFLIDLFMRMKR